VRDDAGRMLLCKAPEHGLIQPLALAVNRGAIGRPLGQPADGLHEGLEQR
jgi:hypothetical protein